MQQVSKHLLSSQVQFVVHWPYLTSGTQQPSLGRSSSRSTADRGRAANAVCVRANRPIGSVGVQVPASCLVSASRYNAANGCSASSRKKPSYASGRSSSVTASTQCDTSDSDNDGKSSLTNSAISASKSPPPHPIAMSTNGAASTSGIRFKGSLVEHEAGVNHAILLGFSTPKSMTTHRPDSAPLLGLRRPPSLTRGSPTRTSRLPSHPRQATPPSPLPVPPFEQAAVARSRDRRRAVPRVNGNFGQRR